jgi:hypothetical protein
LITVETWRKAAMFVAGSPSTRINIGQLSRRDRAEIICAQMLRCFAGRHLENSEEWNPGALVMFYFDVSNLAEVTETAEGVGAHWRMYPRLDDALEVRVTRRCSVLFESD